MSEPNGQKQDYRSLIKWMAGIIISFLLVSGTYMVNSQVKLDNKIERKVSKTQYLLDKQEIKEHLDEVKKDVKDFRKDMREDMKELKALIKKVNK